MTESVDPAVRGPRHWRGGLAAAVGFMAVACWPAAGRAQAPPVGGEIPAAVAEALREECGSPRDPVTEEENREPRAAAVVALGEEEFRRFWEEGAPLFDALTAEPHPHTAHQIVQTLHHLLALYIQRRSGQTS